MLAFAMPRCTRLPRCLACRLIHVTMGQSLDVYVNQYVVGHAFRVRGVSLVVVRGNTWPYQRPPQLLRQCHV